MLREKIVAVLGAQPKWWKQCIPGSVRQEAEKRRKLDRQSPYAPALAFHEIYYCYLDDLRQIISSSTTLPLFGLKHDLDLKPRFEELLALRNRAAHGRFLLGEEADRVTRLVEELRTLLALTQLPASLSYEDPRALRAGAVNYLRTSLTAMAKRIPPQAPDALRMLLTSPSLTGFAEVVEEATVRDLIVWFEELHALKGRRGYKLLIASQVREATQSGRLARADRLIAELSGQIG